MRSLIIGLLLLTSAGCASTGGYFLDRGRDAADIVTLTVGLGIGAKARVGNAQIGLLVQGDAVGLRGGKFQDDFWYWHCCDYDLLFLFHPVTGDFGQEVYSTRYATVRTRNKTYKTDKRTPFTNKGGVMTYGGKDRQTLPACYYSQIEAVVGLGPSVRLGFNPGELVDFILGWTKIDIYDDDLSQRQKNPHIKSAVTIAPTS